MDENNRNFILAIVLSICVLIFWQVFYAGPKMQKEQERRKNLQQTEKVIPPEQTPSSGEVEKSSKSPLPGSGTPAPSGVSSKPVPTPQSAGVPTPSGPSAQSRNREVAIEATPRLPIETDSLRGSINLKGGRIDDLVLKKYKVTVKPDSANVTLLSPSGSRNPYYAEYGWVPAVGEKAKLPDQNTVWEIEGAGELTSTSPVTLKYDNGEGLIFRRTISVDDNYKFVVRQEIENKSAGAVTLHPYALISRHGKPETQSFYILHEGLIGVLGEDGLQEIDYSEALEDRVVSFPSTSGWLGITDKYWAAVLMPDPNAKFQARFSGNQVGAAELFQTDYLLGAVTVEPGTKESVSGNLFAGAKENHVIDKYGEELKLDRFDLLIDWGWFYFLTKPMFYALDYFYKLVGNFGLSILIVTVIIKLMMFPLANKSYVSMSKMKKLQPEMTKIRERFAEDKMRQQQAMMELYKKEKVNPMSGCLPILIQIPVFFALYKVLFVTIEMRHAPFFGWIKDLSAPDPTSVFNLFGLIPWSPPAFLMIGVWPLIMGVTMWVQMKLNPQQPDPIQQKIFAWMPVIFTFLLAPFPAGLVIYWAWNNLLSIIQQWYIMHRQGVKVDLLDNMGFNKLHKRWAEYQEKRE